MTTCPNRWLPIASFLWVATAGSATSATVVKWKPHPDWIPAGSPPSAFNYPLDVNGDHVTDVEFSYAYGRHHGVPIGPTMSDAFGSNGAEIAAGPPDALHLNYVTHFGAGELIGPAASYFVSGSINSIFRGGNENGMWGSANGPHFLGFRFPVNGQTHYGWAEIYHDSSYASEVGIVSVAYETRANTPIVTAPEPGAAVLWAFAPALALCRRWGRRRTWGRQNPTAEAQRAQGAQSQPQRRTGR